MNKDLNPEYINVRLIFDTNYPVSVQTNFVLRHKIKKTFL